MKPISRLNYISNVFTELQTFDGRSFRKSGSLSYWHLEEVYVCVRFRRSKWACEHEFLFYSDFLIGSKFVFSYRKNIDPSVQRVDCHQYLNHISEAERSGQQEWAIAPWSEPGVINVVGNVSSRFDNLIQTDLIQNCLTNSGLIDGLLKESVWPNMQLRRTVDVGIMAMQTGNKPAAQRVLNRMLQIGVRSFAGDSVSEALFAQLKDYVAH